MKLSFSRENRVLAVRLLAAVLFLLPIFWMVAAALHPLGVPLPQKLVLFSAVPTLDNFARAWDLVPIGRYALNSLLVVALAVPITLVSSSWAGYGMSRLPRPSQRRWVVISLAVLMVPGIALWFTRFLIFKQLGWLDTIWALIAPAWMGTSSFYVLMFYRAFRRIPAAVYDAARIDGAGILQTWWLVILPMARPTALGVGLLTFVVYWGDFISPLLYLDSESLYTLPIALQLLQMMSRSEWALLMAAAVITTFIPVLLFIILQPYFARVGD
jgi:multiple sugar transport system permease protein